MKTHNYLSKTALAAYLCKWVRTPLLLTLLLVLTFQARAGQAQISIVYSPGLDFACSLLRGGAIKDEWKNELLLRKPEFDALWENVGPRLMTAAEAITGKPFPDEKLTARLTLCNLPSQSIAGISVNMRYALQSFVSPPVPMRYKVDTLFHELLHVFIAAHPVSNSALLAQHSTESECTRNHLHVLALQKAVLVKLQQPDALQDIVAIDSQLPGGCYKKAWAIVNATDTEYLNYVAELVR